jgi:hypothetical protein
MCFDICFAGQTGWSQADDRSMLNGRITANSTDLEGVYVVNAQTEVMTTTNELGAFSIIAKPGDEIVFSSIQFKENRLLLKAENFL